MSAPCDGLVAVVTGGASGIGNATATRLRQAGAEVVVVDTQPLAGRQPELGFRQVDVTDPDATTAAIDAIASAHGGIDLLVNNAGIGATGTVEENDEQEWLRIYDVNVLGVVRTTRAALPYLRRSRHAAIVNVSSIAATAGLPLRACYSASKGAVLSLTLAMAADLVADRVRVNCVTPGTVGTPWVQRLLDAAPDPAAERSALAARQPLGRLGTADEVAAVIVFLASPAAGFVTGAVWSVDGGMAGLRLGGRARDAQPGDAGPDPEAAAVSGAGAGRAR